MLFILLYGVILGLVLFLNIPFWVFAMLVMSFITFHAIKTA